MKVLSLTVLQFNTFVKNILDAEEFLSNISVIGEVTNLKISGGNAYFDLKDESALLSCVKFGAYDLSIKNGDMVTVYGKVNFYIKSGRLNFIVGRVEAYGLGNLYQNFLELKKKLEDEGLFKEEIKKPIPKFAKNIGVVTSETGAVIRDIIHVARSKNPFTNIIVYPVKVQGVGAEYEIQSGIEYFNTREDIDTIIVARGGGSLEDLAPFNTETVVRAIFNSEKPIISGVGHETDFTLCDFASDLRVPTPSVASEVAVFDYYEQVNNILTVAKNIQYFVERKREQCKGSLVNISKFVMASMKLKLSDNFSKVKIVVSQVANGMASLLTNWKMGLEKTADYVESLSPLKILKRGYAIVEKEGKRVTSAKDVQVGQALEIGFSDGSVTAKVENKNLKDR